LYVADPQTKLKNNMVLMKVNEVISKLRVMLGAETEVVTAVKFAEVTLVDGTVLTTEGELAEGSILKVAVAEGEAPFAPEGMHETSEGLLITVGANGEVMSIETKSEEAPAEAPAEEVAMEEEVTVEVPEEQAPAVEEIVNAIAELIQPQTAVIEELKEKLATLEARFNQVADEPAAKPVKNTFAQEAASSKSIAERRLEHIISLKRGKN
jgi:uncharacterized protein YuzE